MPAEGTYRSVCGNLLHCHLDEDGHAWWSAEDEIGRRAVEIAPAARLRLLSDDPDWPCGPERIREPVLEID